MESLDNQHFISTIEVNKNKKIEMKREKEREQQEKKMERMEKKIERDEKKAISLQNKKEKQTSILNVEDNVDIMEIGEENLDQRTKKGRLIKKLQKYKESFLELSNIKINSKDSVEKLEELIIECQQILETNWIDSFITDSFHKILEQIEPLTVHTKCNIKNLSATLRKDEHFCHLMKQCSLKYGSFVHVSCEYSLIMSIIGTTYLVIVQNSMQKVGVKTNEDLEKNRQNISAFLNKKI